MRAFLFGLLIGLCALPVAAWCWLRWGHPPVAVADAPLPFERAIVHMPLHRRVAQQMPQHAAMDATPVNLLLGAEIYRDNCAQCHGLYGRPSPIGHNMYPHAPQLWAPHGNGVVGVSDDPAGATFWKVQNGIRLSGMPAFDHTLNQAQMWQVSLLLAHAAEPLPPNVLGLLQQPFAPASTPAQTAPQQSAPGATDIPVQPLPTQ